MNECHDECTKYLVVSKNFMKNQFKKSHEIDDDYCCFHGFTYAMSQDLETRNNTNDNGCTKFLFFVSDRLKSLMRTNPSMKSDWEHEQNVAMRVIDGILEKVNLFLDHQTRCQVSDQVYGYFVDRIGYERAMWEITCCYNKCNDNN